MKRKPRLKKRRKDPEIFYDEWYEPTGKVPEPGGGVRVVIDDPYDLVPPMTLEPMLTFHYFDPKPPSAMWLYSDEMVRQEQAAMDSLIDAEMKSQVVKFAEDLLRRKP